MRTSADEREAGARSASRADVVGGRHADFDASADVLSCTMMASGVAALRERTLCSSCASLSESPASDAREVGRGETRVLRLVRLQVARRARAPGICGAFASHLLRSVAAKVALAAVTTRRCGRVRRVGVVETGTSDHADGRAESRRRGAAADMRARR